MVAWWWLIVVSILTSLGTFAAIAFVSINSFEIQSSNDFSKQQDQ